MSLLSFIGLWALILGLFTVGWKRWGDRMAEFGGEQQ
jgi:hypothetical protein